MLEKKKKLKDDYFEEVTQLLKDAGDRAWAKIGNRSNGLWEIINKAEKAKSTQIRKENINIALIVLEQYKDILYIEDYDFIKEKLTQSNELTE